MSEWKNEWRTKLVSILFDAVCFTTGLSAGMVILMTLVDLRMGVM